MSIYSINILSVGLSGQATKGKRASLLMDVVILVLYIVGFTPGTVVYNLKHSFTHDIFIFQTILVKFNNIFESELLPIGLN